MMNNELPQPVRKALSRKQAGVHPSPDVLTAFAEHTLAAKERQGVSYHLATCSECRQVVFLANGAAEESTLVLRPEPTRRWFRLVWAAPALAAIVLVSAVLLQRHDALLRKNPAPLTLASNQYASKKNPQPSVPVSNAAERPPESEAMLLSPQAERRRAAITLSPKRPSSAAVGDSAAKSSALQEFAYYSHAAPAPPSAAADQTATQALASALAAPGATSPAPLPKQSSFLSNQADQEAQLPQPSAARFAKPQVAARGLGDEGQWRISADGHLERLMSAHTWTRVLAEAPTTFRTVAVIGQDLWAGGSGGALFHSHDGGQHWSKVALTSAGVAESSPIVSILFDDPQHGAVGTTDGTRWLTTDGGVSWEKQ